ncbi:kinase-associated lipoprotein B [Aquibacillus kalidii]|uniref:kinase-associated lipoprotein B n=1 Tax=Aquibacillus kalidii TaxID=2762597 RepID=UPI0016441B69|nr:kinase-associated lipoprotein B [Aquibacillus kalidii]
MDDAKNGDIVRAHYRSGSYIGEVMEDRGEKYLIKVLAVVKHPLQGDLHNFGETEGVFFHQRKALSYQEKMNVSKSAVHPYSDTVPSFNESLKDAIHKLRSKLQEKDSEFNQKALASIDQLENEYFK